MIIRNSIIITDDQHPIEMAIGDLPNFSGNVVFQRSKLPPDLLKWLDEAVSSSENNAAAAETARSAMQNKSAA